MALPSFFMSSSRNFLSVGFDSTTRFSLPAILAKASNSLQMSWIFSWAKRRALTITSSLTSLAPDSTIEMAPLCPATMRSRVLTFICS